MNPPSFTDVEKEKIRLQVEKIVSSPLFSASPRCAAFLRYVVDQVLNGSVEELKERTVGVEVFGKDPAYDTSADPVVRVTAVKVRQRLKRYYAEPDHQREIRIELLPGTYLPLIRFPESDSQAESGSDPIAPEDISAATTPAVIPSRSRSLRLVLWISPSLALGLLVTFLISRVSSPVRRFWGPVWNSSPSVLLCVGAGSSGQREPTPREKPLSILDVIREHRIAWADAVTTARLAALMGVNQKQCLIRRSADVDLTVLKEQPSVLIGGYNNEWLLHFTQGLRFTLRYDPSVPLAYIADSAHPENRQWAVNPSYAYSTFSEDYGLVSRFYDPSVQQMIVVVSGLAYYGTMAAGELVTDPRYLRMLSAYLGPNSKSRNVQVVFSVRIVRGEIGVPSIEAVHVW